jgi:hypothetical protein
MAKGKSILALLALTLASCNSFDLSSLVAKSSLKGFGETIADEAGNSIVVNRGVLYSDRLVLEADLMAKDFVLFSFQLLPLPRAYMDLDATNKASNTWMAYGKLNYKNPVHLNMTFLNITSLDAKTTYYINFGITETGYPSTYFTFTGAQIIQ